MSEIVFVQPAATLQSFSDDYLIEVPRQDSGASSTFCTSATSEFTTGSGSARTNASPSDADLESDDESHKRNSKKKESTGGVVLSNTQPLRDPLFSVPCVAALSAECTAPFVPAVATFKEAVLAAEERQARWMIVLEWTCESLALSLQISHMEKAIARQQAHGTQLQLAVDADIVRHRLQRLVAIKEHSPWVNGREEDASAQHHQTHGRGGSVTSPFDVPLSLDETVEVSSSESDEPDPSDTLARADTNRSALSEDRDREATAASNTASPKKKKKVGTSGKKAANSSSITAVGSARGKKGKEQKKGSKSIGASTTTTNARTDKKESSRESAAKDPSKQAESLHPAFVAGRSMNSFRRPSVGNSTASVSREGSVARSQHRGAASNTSAQQQSSNTAAWISQTAAATDTALNQSHHNHHHHLRSFHQEVLFTREITALEESRERASILLEHFQRVSHAQVRSAFGSLPSLMDSTSYFVVRPAIEKLEAANELTSKELQSCVATAAVCEDVAQQLLSIPPPLPPPAVVAGGTTEPATVESNPSEHRTAQEAWLEWRASIISVATPRRNKAVESEAATKAADASRAAEDAKTIAELRSKLKTVKQAHRDDLKAEKQKRRKLHAALREIQEEAASLSYAIDGSLAGLGAERAAGGETEDGAVSGGKASMVAAALEDDDASVEGSFALDGASQRLGRLRKALESTASGKGSAAQPTDEELIKNVANFNPVKVMDVASSLIDELRNQVYRLEEKQGQLEYSTAVAKRKAEKLRQVKQTLQTANAALFEAMLGLCSACRVRLPRRPDVDAMRGEGEADAVAFMEQTMVVELQKAFQVLMNQIEWQENKNRRDEAELQSFLGPLFSQVGSIALACGVASGDKRVTRHDAQPILAAILLQLENKASPRETTGSGNSGPPEKCTTGQDVLGASQEEEVIQLREMVRQMRNTIDALSTQSHHEDQGPVGGGSGRGGADGVVPPVSETAVTVFNSGHVRITPGTDAFTMVLKRLEETRHENYALLAALDKLEEEKRQRPTFIHELLGLDGSGAARTSPTTTSAVDDDRAKTDESTDTSTQLAALRQSHALLREELENEMDEKTSLERKLRDAERFIAELQRQCRQLRQSCRGGGGGAGKSYDDEEYENIGDDLDEDEEEWNSDEEEGFGRIESIEGKKPAEHEGDRYRVFQGAYDSGDDEDEDDGDAAAGAGKGAVAPAGVAGATSHTDRDCDDPPHRTIVPPLDLKQKNASVYVNPEDRADFAEKSGKVDEFEEGDADEDNAGGSESKDEEERAAAVATCVTEQLRLHKRMQATPGVHVAVLFMSKEASALRPTSPGSKLALAPKEEGPSILDLYEGLRHMEIACGLSLHCFIGAKDATTRRVAILYPQRESHRNILPDRQLVHKLFSAARASHGEKKQANGSTDSHSRHPPSSASPVVPTQPLVSLCDLRIKFASSGTVPFEGSRMWFLSDDGAFAYISVPPSSSYASVAQGAEQQRERPARGGSNGRVKQLAEQVSFDPKSVSRVVEHLCTPDLLDIPPQNRFYFTACFPSGSHESTTKASHAAAKKHQRAGSNENGDGDNDCGEASGAWIPADKVGWVGHRVCAFATELMHFSSPAEKERFLNHLNEYYDLVLHLNESEVRNYVGGCVEIVSRPTEGSWYGSLGMAAPTTSPSGSTFARRLCLTLRAFGALTAEHRANIISWYAGAQNLIIVDIGNIEGIRGLPLKRLMACTYVHRKRSKAQSQEVYPNVNVTSILRIKSE